MSYFNPYGLAIMILIMIPNIWYAATDGKGSGHKKGNKIVEILEQIGRYGCFALMIFNIPYSYRGFWLENGLFWYIAINALLVFAYCLVWAVCLFRRKYPLWGRIALSALPSAVFLVSGAMILSFPLLLSALLFAPCHIFISIQNH